MTAGADIAGHTTMTSFDVQRIRADFPILNRRIGDRPLVYLDNAATTQKPEAVIEAIAGFYRSGNSNVHRGVHRLSMEATDGYEAAREKVRSWINAASVKEVVFVRGATEAINLVAATYGDASLAKGDEIVITGLEHHSNIVPWQLLCERKGCLLKVVPIEDDGSVTVDAFRKTLSERTKLVALNHVSNALGTVSPVKDMTAIAHAQGSKVLIDGAQALPHGRVDVRDIDCDFYVFSGHKMYGPTGIGVLYGKEALLESMPPYQGGGDMIRSVTFERTTFNDLPYKFEAGTPNIAGTIGLGAAVDYLSDIGMDEIHAYEQYVTDYALEALSEVPGINILGPSAAQKGGVAAFTLAGTHPHDVAEILDKRGIAVRAGHHCAMPLHHKCGLNATTRASFYLYTTTSEVDQLVEGLHHVRQIFRL